MHVRTFVAALALGLTTSVLTLSAPAVAEDAGHSDAPEPSSTSTPEPEPVSPEQAAPETSSPEEPTASESSGAETTPGAPSAPRASGYFSAPYDGQVFVGNETVRFAVAGVGDWFVEGECDGTWFSADWRSPSIRVPARSYSISCSATLYDAWYDSLDQVSFEVTPGQLSNEIRNLNANPRSFFPLVRDGYRDAVRFTLGTRNSAMVTMTVRNSAGTKVRTMRVHGARSWGGSWYSRDSIKWNGKRNNGARVPTGAYKVTFTSTGANLPRASKSIWVRVKTGTQTIRRTKTLDGWYGSSDVTRGNCTASETWYPHGNFLDCWGGNYAQASYRFPVPANAVVTDWWAYGSRSCCDTGRVIRTGERVAPRAFRVRVRVTNWAAFTVTKAGITYRYTRRI